MFLELWEPRSMMSPRSRAKSVKTTMEQLPWPTNLVVVVGLSTSTPSIGSSKNILVKRRDCFGEDWHTRSDSDIFTKGVEEELFVPLRNRLMGWTD